MSCALALLAIYALALAAIGFVGGLRITARPSVCPPAAAARACQHRRSPGQGSTGAQLGEAAAAARAFNKTITTRRRQASRRSCSAGGGGTPQGGRGASPGGSGGWGGWACLADVTVDTDVRALRWLARASSAGPLPGLRMVVEAPVVALPELLLWRVGSSGPPDGLPPRGDGAPDRRRLAPRWGTRAAASLPAATPPPLRCRGPGTVPGSDPGTAAALAG